MRNRIKKTAKTRIFSTPERVIPPYAAWQKKPLWALSTLSLQHQSEIDWGASNLLLRCRSDSFLARASSHNRAACGQHTQFEQDKSCRETYSWQHWLVLGRFSGSQTDGRDSEGRPLFWKKQFFPLLNHAVTNSIVMYPKRWKVAWYWIHSTAVMPFGVDSLSGSCIWGSPYAWTWEIERIREKCIVWIESQQII